MITVLVSLLIACLVWLVVTNSIKLPLLADTGLGTIALGGVIWVDAFEMKGDTFTPVSILAILFGVFLLLLSSFREKKKKQEVSRKSEPRVIEGHHLKNASGGKR